MWNWNITHRRVPFSSYPIPLSFPLHIPHSLSLASSSSPSSSSQPLSSYSFFLSSSLSPRSFHTLSYPYPYPSSSSSCSYRHSSPNTSTFTFTFTHLISSRCSPSLIHFPPPPPPLPSFLRTFYAPSAMPKITPIPSSTPTPTHHPTPSTPFSPTRQHFKLDEWDYRVHLRPLPLFIYLCLLLSFSILTIQCIQYNRYREIAFCLDRSCKIQLLVENSSFLPMDKRIQILQEGHFWLRYSLSLANIPDILEEIQREYRKITEDIEKEFAIEAQGVESKKHFSSKSHEDIDVHSLRLQRILSTRNQRISSFLSQISSILSSNREFHPSFIPYVFTKITQLFLLEGEWNERFSTKEEYTIRMIAMEEMLLISKMMTESLWQREMRNPNPLPLPPLSSLPSPSSLSFSSFVSPNVILQSNHYVSDIIPIQYQLSYLYHLMGRDEEAENGMKVAVEYIKILRERHENLYGNDNRWQHPPPSPPPLPLDNENFSIWKSVKWILSRHLEVFPFPTNDSPPIVLVPIPLVEPIDPSSPTHIRILANLSNYASSTWFSLFGTYLFSRSSRLLLPSTPLWFLRGGHTYSYEVEGNIYEILGMWERQKGKYAESYHWNQKSMECYGKTVERVVDRLHKRKENIPDPNVLDEFSRDNSPPSSSDIYKILRFSNVLSALSFDSYELNRHDESLNWNVLSLSSFYLASCLLASEFHSFHNDSSHSYLPSSDQPADIVSLRSPNGNPQFSLLSTGYDKSLHCWAEDFDIQKTEDISKYKNNKMNQRETERDNEEYPMCCRVLPMRGTHSFLLKSSSSPSSSTLSPLSPLPFLTSPLEDYADISLDLTQLFPSDSIMKVTFKSISFSLASEFDVLLSYHFYHSIILHAIKEASKVNNLQKNVKSKMNSSPSPSLSPSPTNAIDPFTDPTLLIGFIPILLFSPIPLAFHHLLEGFESPSKKQMDSELAKYYRISNDYRVNLLSQYQDKGNNSHSSMDYHSHPPFLPPPSVSFKYLPERDPLGNHFINSLDILKCVSKIYENLGILMREKEDEEGKGERNHEYSSLCFSISSTIRQRCGVQSLPIPLHLMREEHVREAMTSKQKI